MRPLPEYSHSARRRARVALLVAALTLSAASHVGLTDFGARLPPWLLVTGRSVDLLALTLLVALGLGLLLGTCTAYGPRQTQAALIRVQELSAIVPSVILLGLVRVGLGQGSVVTLALALGALKSLGVARVTLRDTAAALDLGYVRTARRFGLSRLEVYRRHVRQRVWPGVARFAPELAAQALALDAALEFVGLGISGHGSWGGELGRAVRAYPADWPRVLGCALGFSACLVATHFCLKTRPALSPP